MARYRNNFSGSASFRSFIPVPLSEVRVNVDDELSALLLAAESSLKRLRGMAMDSDTIAGMVYEESKASWQLSSGRNDNPFSFCFGDVTLTAEDKEEIDDIVAATDYGVDMLAELPLSTRLFLQLHYIISRSARYSKKYPGEYRRSPLWMGIVGSGLRTARYVAPVVEDMIPAISELENYINYDTNANPLVRAALIHYQIEAIHPFIDANGRFGRLLNTLYLMENGMLTHPVLLLSDALKRAAAQYYILLQEVTDTGAYESWVKFFVDMIGQAASASADRLAGK